jgi:CRP-like cAMP-binding protein
MSISPAEFSKIALFKSLSYEDLEDVLFKCVLLRIEPGSVVIAPGQPNRRLYILVRGEMSIHLNDVNAEPVATLQRGDVFGELSVIDAQPASAYVVARAPCRLLGIDKDSWWEMFRLTPNIAINLMNILARRIRDTNRQLQGSQEPEVEEPKLDQR